MALKSPSSSKTTVYVISCFAINLYLNQTSDDIDICTNAKYDDLKLIFDDIENKGFGSYLLKFNIFIDIGLLSSSFTSSFIASIASDIST